MDANGNRTEYVVNVTWGSVQRTIDATGAATNYTYDRLGRLVQVRDPIGQPWMFEYDMFGRQTNATDPLGATTRTLYDAAGNDVARIDANGNVTNYTYDALNRVIQIQHDDGTLLAYGYDEIGNLVNETGYGFTRTRAYDALDRIEEVAFDFGPFTKAVRYTYDAEGNRRTMTYPSGLTVTYTWDGHGRLVGIDADDATSDLTWSLAYDDDGRLTALRHPNGLELNWMYDAADRLLAVRTIDLATADVLEGFNYTHDAVGNRETTGQEANDTRLSSKYRNNYILADTTYETGETSAYAYDDNGNRLFRNESAGFEWFYTYNPDSSLDHVRQRVGNTILLDLFYDYDGNGNLVSRVESVPGRGDTRYGFEYDLRGRLARVLVDGVEIASYGYFLDGARVRRTEDGVTTYYVYDFWDFAGFNDILEEYDAGGHLTARYVHGPGADEPLGMDRASGWHYYHVDGLGSITMVTDATKAVVNRYVYDDFGNFRATWENVSNPYGFTGRETDVLGLAYYRARYYDSEIGRFLTRDPAEMADVPNVYAYAGNNPISLLDPSGQQVGPFVSCFWVPFCLKGWTWVGWFPVPVFGNTWCVDWGKVAKWLYDNRVATYAAGSLCILGLSSVIWTTCSVALSTAWTFIMAGQYWAALGAISVCVAAVFAWCGVLMLWVLIAKGQRDGVNRLTDRSGITDLRGLLRITVVLSTVALCLRSSAGSLQLSSWALSQDLPLLVLGAVTVLYLRSGMAIRLEEKRRGEMSRDHISRRTRGSVCCSRAFFLFQSSPFSPSLP